MLVLKKWIELGYQSFCQFWFEFKPTKSAVLFRYFFGATLFLSNLERFFRFNAYFGDSKFLNREQAFSLSEGFYRPPFFWGFWPDSWNLIIYILFLVGIIFFTLGRGGRPLIFLLWIASYGFIQKNPLIAFGVDFISTLFLFYLIFTPIASPRVWKNPLIQKLNQMGLSLGLRLIQVQLCVIYFFSGAEKLKGSAWWDGSALWAIMSNPQTASFDFGYLRYFSLFIVFFNYLTLLFELFFPALVWNKSIVKPVLFLGIFFHVGIGLFLGLWSFSLLMLCPYILFFEWNKAKS